MIWNKVISITLETTMIVFLTIPLMSFMFLEFASVPKIDLWPRWETYNPVSQELIDHSQWNRFLRVYVKKDDKNFNRIAYSQISKGGKRELDQYIELLEKTPISLYTRNEQMAFWINFYNALTVRLIIEFYPLSSIQNIPSAWDKKIAKVEGKSLTLNDIEHRILRPIWRDARIHYLLNCGALGCPNLLKIAITGQNLSQLLDLAAHNYINNHRAVRIEKEELIVSKIYKWYHKDFGGTDYFVIEHIKSYAESGLLKMLKGKKTIKDYEYDWTLNDLDDLKN